MVPPGDPTALAEALASLIDDAALRSRLGQAGRQRAETVYGFSAHIAAFTAVYEAVAAATWNSRQEEGV